MPAGSELGQALMVPVSKTADKAQPPSSILGSPNGAKPPKPWNRDDPGSRTQAWPPKLCFPSITSWVGVPLAAPSSLPFVNVTRLMMPISSVSKSYSTLSRYSITTIPQGDNLLVTTPVPWQAQLFCTAPFRGFPGCFPSHRDVTPWGLAAPLERAGSHQEVQGCSAPAPGDLSMRKSPICPWMCHQQSLPCW